MPKTVGRPITPMGSTSVVERDKAMRSLERRLGARRVAFCHAYLAHGAEPAAQQAALRDCNYADSSGKALLRSPDVLQYIQLLQLEHRARNIVSEERILQEYAKLAFLDPRQFYDADGNLLPIHELPPDVAAAITGMDVQIRRDSSGQLQSATAKLKLADKKGALDSLSRTLGLFTDKLDVTHSVSVADSIRQARAERDITPPDDPHQLPPVK